MYEKNGHYEEEYHKGSRPTPHRYPSLSVRVCWASSCVAGFLCFLGVLVWVLLSTPPGATISSGQVTGKWMRSRAGRDIAAFEGIPYAAPPVKELRFQDPKPVAPWSGVFVASEPGSKCLQSGGDGIAGNEDCLYLNVYSPEGVQHDKPLDVLFYIHGGGWVIGSGDLHQPDFILDRDIVLVTINYRLGILGFLAAPDLGLSGNFGLKDTVAALRWVKENIASFGGNPDSVTIAGQSAGAASVGLLHVSPLAKGLFHKAISMSGLGMALWSVAPEGESEIQTSRLARILGCPSRSQLLSCLEKKSGKEITAGGSGFVDWLVYPYISFKAVVEWPEQQGAFMTRYPQDVLAQDGPVSDVPYMAGISSEDGGLFSVSILTNETATQELNDRFEEVVPITLMIVNQYPQQEMTDFMKKVRKFYLGDRAVSLNVTKEVTNIFTDGGFASPVSELSRALHIHGKSPLFVYEFAFQSSVSFAMEKGANGTEFGVFHGDELLVLFPMRESFPTLVRRDIEVEMSRKFIDLIVTFANTGKPTHDDLWQPASDMEYLRLKAPNDVSMRSSYEPDRMQLWRQLPLKLHPAAISK